MISKELWKQMIYGTRDERVYIARRSFEAFALYYFSDFFDYQIPQFHLDFYQDFQDLVEGRLTEVAWIAFAESAKTTITKIGVQWIIAAEKKRYINWDSYDISNPENALFDIIVSLQTNQKLRDDFGDLYIEKRTQNEKTLKKVSAFITTNKIKVEAFSAGISPRGRIYGKYRPDFYIFDDIENVKTRRSGKITKSVIEHYDEVKRGMSTDASVLTLGNYISETGSVQYIMDRIAKNPKGRVRNIGVIDRNGDIAWKSKYVHTDEEAAKLNMQIKDPKKHVISLETKRRDLGDQNYKENMLNDPAGAAEPFFDRIRVDSDIQACKEPLENNGGLRVYARFNPAHRYAIGGDTSMGVGLDSNASAVFDFTRRPNLLVGAYSNNTITPDVFAYELKRQGNLYGECLVAPESNGESGGACVNTLKRIYKNIYRTRVTNHLFNKATLKIGWRTTSASKPEMLFKFKSDYEDGTIQIRDLQLLKEMRSFTTLDMHDTTSAIDTSRHFDLLMAACIGNMMREYANYTPTTKRYQQPDYESPSIDAPEKRVVTVQRASRAINRADYESSGLG